MKKVFVQPISAGNGRYTYDLIDLNGGYAGGDGVTEHETLGEAYEAGIRHVEAFPESFALVSPAAVAALLKEAYYHLRTLSAYEDAVTRQGSNGLKENILAIEKMLFV